jgi:NAD(P)H dehydrogenase (quinone)
MNAMRNAFFLALACTAAAWCAPPVRVLVAYHSQTGNTEKMAQAVRDGLLRSKDADVTLKKLPDVTDSDITAADGIIVGTPVHWQNLAADTKRFLDRVAEALGRKGKTWGEGRTAGVFCTSGAIGGGQELARLSVISAFLGMRFVIVGGVNNEEFGTLGPQAVTGGALPGVGPKDLEEARLFGARFARVTRQFKGR